MINKERLKLGVDALRSGQYEQARGSLMNVAPDGQKSYCCLGVLCDIAVKNGVVGVTPVEVVHDPGFVIAEAVRGDGEGCIVRALLPHVVREWYGFDSVGPSVRMPSECGDEPYEQELTYLNDNIKATFAEIADAIEATYLVEEE